MARNSEGEGVVSDKAYWRQLDWGSIAGDKNAKTIVEDRKRAGDTLALVVTAAFFAMVLCGGWYARDGSRVALALEIVLAAFCAAGWARKDVYQLHTYVLIAEQRARNIEGAVEAKD